MFNPLVCKILYLWYSIRNVGPWIIRIEDSWKVEKNLYVAHKTLCNQINLMGKGLFDGSFNSKVKKQKAIFPKIIKLLNFLITHFIENKKVFFITDNSSAFKALGKRLKAKNSNFCFVQFRGGTDVKSIIISIINIFYYLLNKSHALVYLIHPRPRQKTKNSLNPDTRPSPLSRW